LCRDSPTLLPDLSRRIAVLLRFDALRSADDDATDEFRADTSPGGTAPPAAGAEIGAVLGITEEAARMRQARALKRFKDLWARLG
jgi:hypothetical protein